MSSGHRVSTVLRSIFLPILSVAVFLFSLNWLVFSISDRIDFEIYVSEPSLGMILTGSVAIVSLYLAWNRFIYKKKPFIRATWDFKENDDGDEVAYLKLINMGESTVGLQGFSWSSGIRRSEESLSLSNDQYEFFDEDHLVPDESTCQKLGENIAVARIESLIVQTVDGETVELETPLKKKNLVRLEHLDGEFSDHQVKVQRLFDRIREVDYGYGTRVSPEDLSKKDIEEIVDEFEENTNKWEEIKKRYEKRRYGQPVMGNFYDDLFSRFLFHMSKNKAENKE